MLIDCDTCTARDHACDDCVVAVLLRRPPGVPADFDPDECTALDRLADAGLVPPLRLVPFLDASRRGHSTRHSA